MIFNIVRVAALAVVALVASACISPKGDTPAQKWDSAHAMRDEYLHVANVENKDLAAELASAPGYLVMDSFVMKILIIGTSNGYGVLVDNRDHSETIIDHFTLAVGPGIEVARVGGVIVFRDPAALDGLKQGVNELGAEAALAFKFGDFGGALRTTTLGTATRNEELFIGGVAIHASVFYSFLSQNEEMPPGK